MKPEITAERLRELFIYDQETGVFTHRIRRKKCFPGTQVGTLTASGYIRIVADGRLYMAHRLAWLYAYGVMPEGVIDHKDRNRSNNALANLRDTTPLYNSQNQLSARNSSGLIGAYRNGRGKFFSQIKVNGASVFLGIFQTAMEAHEAYMKAKRELHPGCIFDDQSEVTV